LFRPGFGLQGFAVWAAADNNSQAAAGEGGLAARAYERSHPRTKAQEVVILTGRNVAIAFGPALALLVYLVLPSGSGAGLSDAGRATAAVATLMAFWWLTEALPLAATALLPIGLFPLLGICSAAKATAPYGDKVIFLFMGGFILAGAMQRWELHRRFALQTIKLVGTSPHRLVAGFMLATAVLSMWVSNTATVIVMLPIATSVLELVGEGDAAGRPGGGAASNFAVALLLGTAYGASIGGVGTLIGTPPNGILAGYLSDNFGYELSFGYWLIIGLPLVVLFLPLAWLLLTQLVFPFRGLRLGEVDELIERELAGMGPMSRAERRVLVVFVVTALCWMLRSPVQMLARRVGFDLSGLNDTSIAILAALALFLLPAGDGSGRRLLDWKTAAGLPWQILVLFGGGLSLAAAMHENGLAEYIGRQFHFGGPGQMLAATFAATLLVKFLTELMSNTATTSALLPVFAGIASAAGIHQFVLLVPATITASFAFMLPVGTPPNAIVFASGLISIRQMSRAGLLLNLVTIVVVPAYVLMLWKILPLPAMGA